MSVRTFADTNIHVYAHTYSLNPLDISKRNIALKYLDECRLVISTQVIREFVNVMAKKGKRTVSEMEEHTERIVEVAELVVEEDLQLIRKAFVINGAYGYSYFDSLIIAAALKADCEILLSEDMQHGQLIEGTLKIVNPFKDV
ncbi:MAG: PIN domain-containing protein [Defluviitaleaceae bacterium]|nr:PIN domain-containing protein [Defluviitaleaceae bacterium]